MICQLPGVPEQEEDTKYPVPLQPDHIMPRKRKRKKKIKALQILKQGVTKLAHHWLCFSEKTNAMLSNVMLHTKAIPEKQIL